MKQGLMAVLACFGILWSPVSLGENTETFLPTANVLSLPAYQQGVEAYRTGNYPQAHQVFSTLHTQYPEVTKVTYYLAITQAQLGRFEQARTLYNEILTLEPNGTAANYARQGLSYLPKTAVDGLDLPPRFQGKPTDQESGLANGNSGLPGVTGSAMPPQGISMQDWMALQMMMGQGGGMNANGMNPMAGMMMPGLGGSAGSAGSLDPNLFSNMLMNQMMQNFSGQTDNNENR